MDPSFGQWPANPLRSEIIFDGSNGAASPLKADTGKIVTSVTRAATGLYDLVLNKDLGTLAFWGCVVGCTTPDRFGTVAFTQATNTLRVTVSGDDGADADSAFVMLILMCGTPGEAA